MLERLVFTGEKVYNQGVSCSSSSSLPRLGACKGFSMVTVFIVRMISHGMGLDSQCSPESSLCSQAKHLYLHRRYCTRIMCPAAELGSNNARNTCSEGGHHAPPRGGEGHISGILVVSAWMKKRFIDVKELRRTRGIPSLHNHRRRVA